jgi:peptidoglycan hydrolase CwlO-like protein
MRIMSTENQNLSHVGEAILQKFVNEEIMTKSELDLKLDTVMSKYIAHIDRKFEHIDRKFEHIDRKFDDMERKVEHIDHRINILKTDMDKRFELVDSRYRWIIGLVIMATLSILSTIIKLH